MDWLADHPEVQTLRVAASDLNGIARGKRLPRAMAEKACGGGVRFPLSVLNVDIMGEDIDGSPLVFASGDPDGVLRPTERGFVPMPWLDTPTALLPVTMSHEDGRAFAGDPRHALARVVTALDAQGLTPVIGTELEFYLIDDSSDGLQVPRSPRSGKRRPGAEILSLRMLDAFDSFFSDLYAGCAAMDIPAETAISESGPGQFEITMGHQASALKAADDAWLFKLLVKGLARQHGFAASFMARPYEDQSGNGFHMHASLTDRDGRNVFDDGGPRGTDALRHAVAGCLAALPGAGLIWAPHRNSYDRLVPGAHAPTGVAWGYENRTVAIRVPGGAPHARRIEHRVSGGDINPYLAMAAFLGGVALGLADKIDPPAPVDGNAYELPLPGLPLQWEDALTRFVEDDAMRRIFAPELIANLVATKRQEQARLADWSREDLVGLYLDTV